MNKMKEKSKYIIGMIVTFLILIFGLNNIAYGRIITFKEFAHKPNWACMEPGAPFRSVTDDKYPLYRTFKGTYTEPYGTWNKAEKDKDGNVIKEGYWTPETRSVPDEKINVTGVPFINDYDMGLGGTVDSTTLSTNIQRQVAFVLYHNTGWKGATQSWIWQHLNDVKLALGKSKVKMPSNPKKLIEIVKGSNDFKYDPLIDTPITKSSVEDDTNDENENPQTEPTVDDGMDANDYNEKETSAEADNYQNFGELSVYMQETKPPILDNLGDDPVITDNANWVGEFKINYDDTHKNEDYESLFDEKKTNYAVSKLSVLTIEYLDGEKVSTPNIPIRQNGEILKGLNDLEKNVPFEIQNPNPDKEIVNIHIELEKWIKTFFVNGQIWTASTAKIDEDKLAEMIKKLKEEFEKKYSEKEDFVVEVKGKTNPTYNPQDPIEITKLGMRAEKITLKLDIPVKVTKGGIGIEKKGLYDDKEENLAGIKFKVYCDTVNKYVKSIEPNTKSLTETEIKFTENFDEAVEWVTGENGTLVIDGLFAGEDYTYKLIEVDGGDNHYYNDPLKLSEASDYTLGHIEENGKKYCTVEGIKVKDGEKDLIEIVIKNDRTSGDLSIDKFDEEDETIKLKGARFKIQLVRSENTDEDHDLGLENKWLIPKGTAGSYDYTNMMHDEYLSDTEVEEEFVADDNGHIDIKCIINGTYHVYETYGYWKYDIEGQTNNEHKYDQDKNWVDIGEVTVSKNPTHIEYKITNMKTRGNLDIEKTDSVFKEIDLSGAEFKLKLEESQDIGAENKWLKNIDNNYYLETHFKEFLTENEDEAGIFVTDKNGKISITGIPNGTYHVYETKMPKGYYMEAQEGYESANHWVNLGTILVDSYKDEGSGDRPTLQYQVSEEHTDTKIQNRKILGPDGLTGFVWIDEPDIAKGGLSEDCYDSLYGNGDSVLAGIKVTLYTKNNELIAETTTGSDGRYHITKWNSSSDKKLHVDPERDDLYYWDLVNSYIEFRYDNKTYVCVDPFEGGKEKVKVNSKAQEYSLSKEELDDTNLTGAVGDLPGKAVTKQKATEGMTPLEILDKNLNNSKYKIEELGLTGYYNDDNFTVEHINLGLWKKIEPTYDILETLEYSKILMNGYTYTYDYDSGESGYADSSMIPSTYEQVSAKYYGAKVYPSDIAYTAEGNPNGMEMYVVYKISIHNSTTLQLSNIYDELRLYLTSLTDTFDQARYAVSNKHAGDGTWEGSQYFGLWNPTDGSYNILGDTSVNGDQMNDGIVLGDTESVYIQFQVQQSFLEDMLAGKLTDDRMNGAVTQAHATGHHAYKRTDNVWSKEESEKYYADSKTRDQEKIQNEFLHRSVDVTKDAGALCLLFALGEERSISGTVFEDTVTKDSLNANENLGNGILDSDEENRAKAIKVELIDASTLENEAIDHHATLYQHTENSTNGKGYEVVSGENTILSTDMEGYYEFKGVVPGLYIIKLTYSDGNQKMIEPNGSEIEITSNDYKSTIINTNEAGDIIKNAMESDYEQMKNCIDTYNNKTNKLDDRTRAQEIVEWYKYLYEKDTDNEYNIATDDFETRSSFTDYEYSKTDVDGKTVIKDSEGAEVEKFPEITSSTPYFSISIENDIEDYSSVGTYEDGYAHSPKYERFNLGLIKTTETKMILNKIISDIKLINTVGTTLVQGNPKEALNYVTALDDLEDGSQYAKIEMALEEIYGSSIETEYTIKIKNESVKDYIENRTSPNYGYYFKYGDKENAYLKTTTVTEVLDEIDGDYDALDGNVDEKVEHPEESRPGQENSSTVAMKVNKTDISNTITFTEWDGIESGGATQIAYKTKGSFQEDMDLIYNNSARISKMQLDLGASLRSDYEWDDASDTRIVITPDTGGDKRPIFFIYGAIALIVIAAGIIVIKKKILK